MIGPLTDAARRFPDQPALISHTHTITFSHLDALVAGCRVLDGLSPGDRIGIIDPDHLPVVPVLLAAWRRGITTVILAAQRPDAAAIAGRLGLVRVLQGSDLVLPAPGSARPAAVLETGIHTVLMTSGSSGRAKAVAHHLHAHLASAHGSNRNIPFGPGHRWQRSLSMAHIGGLAVLFRALVGGGAVVFGEGHDPTHLSLVAVQLRRLLARPVLPPLSALLVGGGPIPPDLIAQALRRGLPVHTTYGCTELASQVTTTPPGATLEQLRTAGRVLAGREVMIAEDGEIRIRGATLLSGYLQDDRLVAGLDDAGWYRTGDVGRLQDGWLTPIGRTDQMFISGGENIHPETIERALAGLVAAAVVVSVPDARWGARPVAFIRGPFDPVHLRRALAQRLSRFEIPDRFLPWPPDTPGQDGKPPRAWLAARARGATV